MKKILALLFICAFSHASFATRILEIYNNSKVEQNFYAIQLRHFDPTIGNWSIYRFSLDPITLKPGEYIRFSQYAPGDNATFPYCPEPPHPTNNYVIHNYCNYVEEWSYSKFRWWSGYELNGNNYTTEYCHEVPRYKFYNDIQFQGFKFYEYLPDREAVNCIGNRMSQNYAVNSTYIYNRLDPQFNPHNVQYDTIGSMTNGPIFYELVTINY